MNRLALVATLNNGKKILIQPNHKVEKCDFRYLSDSEIADETLYTDKRYIWLDAPVYRTIEDGKQVVFTIVEANPIVLARF